MPTSAAVLDIRILSTTMIVVTGKANVDDDDLGWGKGWSSETQ